MVHQARPLFYTATTLTWQEAPYTTSELQRYIKYGRSIKPQMTPQAARKLVDFYRELRMRDGAGSSTGSYRVTVAAISARSPSKAAVMKAVATFSRGSYGGGICITMVSL